MALPNVFSVDTILYHPVEGPKLFPAGETNPGRMWSEHPGGEPIGASSTAEAMKELLAAQDRIDRLEAQLQRNAHDLAVMAKERGDALAQVQGLDQAARDAQKAQRDAEEVAAVLTQERDQARSMVSDLQAQIARFDPDGDGAPGGSQPSEPMSLGAIPEDWAQRHWKQRVKLAEVISGGDVPDVEGANQIIAAEVERRKAI